MPAKPPSARQRDDRVVLNPKELEAITAELRIHRAVIESLAHEIFCSWRWPDGPIDDIGSVPTPWSRKRH
jgi:hypothetical protein